MGLFLHTLFCFIFSSLGLYQYYINFGVKMTLTSDIAKANLGYSWARTFKECTCWIPLKNLLGFELELHGWITWPVNRRDLILRIFFNILEFSRQATASVRQVSKSFFLDGGYVGYAELHAKRLACHYLYYLCYLFCILSEYCQEVDRTRNMTLSTMSSYKVTRERTKNNKDQQSGEDEREGRGCYEVSKAISSSGYQGVSRYKWETGYSLSVVSRAKGEIARFSTWEDGYDFTNIEKGEVCSASVFGFCWWITSCIRCFYKIEIRK